MEGVTVSAYRITLIFLLIQAALTLAEDYVGANEGVWVQVGDMEILVRSSYLFSHPAFPTPVVLFVSVFVWLLGCVLGFAGVLIGTLGNHGGGSSKQVPQRAQTRTIAKRLTANIPISRFPVYRHQPIRRHTLVEVSEHLLIRLQVVAHISVYSKPLAYPFLLLYRGKSLHEFPDEQSNILFSIHFYFNI